MNIATIVIVALSCLVLLALPRTPGIVAGAAPVVPLAAVHSTPLSLEGPCGHNVAVALRRIGPVVSIPPGGAWSFNGAIGDLDGLDYVMCAGVPAGAWCDLASRYAWMAAELGAGVAFPHHGVQLAGVPWEYSVAIWSYGGAGGQDLTITNTTGRTLVLTARDEGGAVVIEGVLLSTTQA